MTQSALPWDAIDTILFDMDGTLLDLHFDNHFWLHHFPRRVSEIHGTPLADVEEKLFAQMRRTRGSLAWYSTDYWSQFMGVDVMSLKREPAASARIAIRDRSDDMLRRLGAMGKELVLITNAHPDVLALKAERTGIDAYFSRALTSHEFDAPKEDRLFWERLQNTVDFDRERTLFVDDSAAVLRAARDYGIAWLRAPLSPDSQRGPVSDHEFATISRFSDMLP